MLAVVPIDFRTLRKKCEGILGWSRVQFWEATLEDVTIALQGYQMRLQDELEVASTLACWIVNGTRIAYHAKNFKDFKPEQLYNRDGKDKSKLTPDERRKIYTDFTSKFPKTRKRRRKTFTLQQFDQ